MSEKEYLQYVEKEKKKMRKTNDLWMAFLYGGFIGLIGQCILLTALGIFDQSAAKAGAGTFIPITGFANSMTSSAIESKPEGFVAGIGSNMFRLAGTVITYGVVSAYSIGVIHYVINFIF